MKCKLLKTFLGALILSFPLITLAAEKATIERFTIIGDSIAAGFQNGTLTPNSQQHSFPALIANQANISFSVPSLTGPTTSIPNNLAVPGERVCDVVQPGAFASNPFAALFHVNMLGVTNTQLSLAEQFAPTTTIVELGANDLLLYAVIKETVVINFMALQLNLTPDQIRQGLLEGNPSLLAVAALVSQNITPENLPLITGIPVTLTDPAVFTGCYQELMSRLVNINSKPALLVSNIPNVMHSPYIKLLVNELILNMNDIQAIQTRLQDFNNIIANQVSAHNAVLVDSFASSNNLNDKGFVVGGNRLNTSFYCGLFSLDGTHPTNTLHAITANEFIKVLNKTYATGIPPLSVVQISKSDPLINLPLCVAPTHPASAAVTQAIAKMGLIK